MGTNMTTDLEHLAGNLERQTAELADAYTYGKMSRRAFITRLLALGLSIPTAGAILAACSAASSTLSSPGSSGAAAELSGEVRMFVGPYTDQELQHHQVIEAAFRQLHPKVTFTYKIWDWSTEEGDGLLDLNQGSHDVYQLQDDEYVNWGANPDLFEDLGPRINDPAFAAEKAQYVFWDRIAKLANGRLIGVPFNWTVENAIFVNLDLLDAAGYGPDFVNSWDTFVAAIQKMTKGTDVYGLQWGLAYVEWYNRARGAGATYLSPDFKTITINTPAVLQITQDQIDLFKHGYAVPVGTYTNTTARAAFLAQKIAVMSTDLSFSPAIQAGKPTFKWSILPAPAGPTAQVNYNDQAFYGISAKAKDKDLCWEVIKWWTNAKNEAYWSDVSGPFAARLDAVANGFGNTAAKQLVDAIPGFVKDGIGLEPFKKFLDVELAVEPVVAQAFSLQSSAADTMANVEKTIKDIVFG
jgi:multiple sugar transport system substrate-binding protein